MTPKNWADSVWPVRARPNMFASQLHSRVGTLFETEKVDVLVVRAVDIAMILPRSLKMFLRVSVGVRVCSFTAAQRRADDPIAATSRKCAQAFTLYTHRRFRPQMSS